MDKRNAGGLAGATARAGQLVRVVAWAGVMAGAAGATAQTLETVTVTGTPAPQSISELPAAVWIVDRAQIEAQVRAGVPLKEALAQWIPGLDAGPQGRTNYGQNLRGRAMLVLVDGVSLNSSRALARQLDAIDPFNIERIEVLSGASAVHGGGATGGIINIVTRRGEAGALRMESEVGVRSGGRTGDHDLRAAHAFSAGNETVRGRLGIALQKNGTAYDGDGQPVRTDITQTDLQYNRSLDITGSLDATLSAGQTLGLRLQHYDSHYDGNTALYLGPNLAGVFTQPQLLAQRTGFRSDVVPSTRRDQASLDYQRPDALLGHDLYVQAFTRREAIDFYPFPGTAAVPGLGTLPFYSASRQDTTVSGVKTALRKSWDRLEMTWGLDLDRERFDADQMLFNTTAAFASGGLVNLATGTTGRYPSYRIDGSSLFAQGQWQASPTWSVSAGLRHQRMRVAVDDFIAATQQVLLANGVGRSADTVAGGRNHYDVNLLNAGVVYKPQAHSQGWLQYSEGFELPDPAKYYGLGRYTLVGGMAGRWTLLNAVDVATSPLAGVKTRQVELGWRQQGGGWSAQAALFHAWSDRSVDTVPLTLAVVVNQRKQRSFGLEAALSRQLPGGWELGGNLLAIRSELRNAAGGWDRQSVALASPSKLTLFAGWGDERWTARLQALRSFDLKDDAGATLEGFSTVDLLGSVKLPVGRLSLGVQNLLDKRYQTAWSQRAQMLYAGLATRETFLFYGRGRTLALNYSVSY